MVPPPARRRRLDTIVGTEYVTDVVYKGLVDEAERYERRKLKSDQSRIRAEERRATTAAMPDVSMSTDENQATESNAKFDARMIPGLSRQIFGFPRSIITKLRYVETPQTYTSVAGAVQTNIWRANSLFDPDQTGVGHQPLYFDQYAALYTKYRVLGARIKVTASAFNDTTDTGLSSVGGPWVVGIGGSSVTTTFGSSIRNRMEQNNSEWKLLNARTGADGVVTVFNVYEPLKDLGIPAGDDTVSAAVTTSPSQPWYWHVWVGSLDTSYTTEIAVITEIDYTVEFFNPVTPMAES